MRRTRALETIELSNHERLGTVERRQAEIDGTLVSWLEAPGPPVLYVHGVPDSAELWTPFLERTGGIAVDLPGFGQSGKPASWPYSLAGYAAFLPAFLDHLGLERVRLVAHDWGAVALTLGHRIDRLVAIDVLPLLPGHRWHWVARAWRTPVVGELAWASPTGRCCGGSAVCRPSMPTRSCVTSTT